MVRKPTPNPRCGCPRRLRTIAIPSRKFDRIYPGGCEEYPHPPRKAIRPPQLFPLSLLGRLGRCSEGLARLFHLLFKCFPRRFPGLLFERHSTTAVTFARLLSGVFAPATLAFAGVLPFAGMRIHRGAVAHSGAGIVPALGFPFASAQAATHMLLP